MLIVSRSVALSRPAWPCWMIGLITPHTLCGRLNRDLILIPGYRDEDDSAAARPVLGPSVPDWVRRQQDEGAAAAVPPPRRYLTGASADFAAAEAALAVAAAARKARKKEKKRKRKEEKAHKEGGKRPQKRKK
jgi:hypothetical protein